MIIDSIIQLFIFRALIFLGEMLPKKVWKWLHWASLLFGILLIVLGVVILSVAPHIIHEQIDEVDFFLSLTNSKLKLRKLIWVGIQMALIIKPF